MSETIQYEIQLLAVSIATGIWLMAAYDGLRVLRMMIRHGNVWTGIEDMIYWLSSGMVTFSLLFRQNDGVLRSFVILGVLFGMLAYHFLVSRTLLGLLKKCRKYFTMRKGKKTN